MPSQNPSKITINLIPHKKISFTEKFLYWLLAVGRYIIIGTELLVFILFLSRFQMDSTLSDLNDKIKQEEVIIKSLENVDKDARSLQIRLSEIKRLATDQKDSPVNLLSYITSLTPDTILINSLSFQDGKILITALGSSSKSFSVFVQNMRSSTRFRDISIGSLDKDELTGGIKFSIDATLVKSEGKK